MRSSTSISIAVGRLERKPDKVGPQNGFAEQAWLPRSLERDVDPPPWGDSRGGRAIRSAPQEGRGNIATAVCVCGSRNATKNLGMVSYVQPQVPNNLDSQRHAQGLMQISDLNQRGQLALIGNGQNVRVYQDPECRCCWV